MSIHECRVSRHCIHPKRIFWVEKIKKFININAGEFPLINSMEFIWRLLCHLEFFGVDTSEVIIQNFLNFPPLVLDDLDIDAQWRLSAKDKFFLEYSKLMPFVYHRYTNGELSGYNVSDDLNVPYDLHTVHPDGGTEILNRALLEFAQKYGIRVTRSWPYHKNDNPGAESRNFTLIRAYVGYCRYDTDAAYEVLAELMPLICKLHSYFMRRYQVFLILSSY